MQQYTSLDAGYSSLTGKRPANEDACLIVTPSTGDYLSFGALFALADGMGGLPDGKGAAEAAVHGLRASYYASPETWALEHALREGFTAANQAVLTGGVSGRATTLSALVIRQRVFGIAHVGDTRVWLCRGDTIKSLTRDHHLPHADIGAMLTRGCGLDETIHCDCLTGELAEGDTFLLTSDGVHEILPVPVLMRISTAAASAHEAAEELTRLALQEGSTDNVTVCVLRIIKLPAETDSDVARSLKTLPVLALPQVGAEVDGFRLHALMHSGRVSTLFQAVDAQSGETVALKFPNPRHADDPAFIECFLREEWLGRRLNSPYVVKVLPLPAGRRTQLYSALAYHAGETLAARIQRKKGLAVDETLEFAQALLTGLDHLHRRGVLHLDVKPENILIDEQQALRLIDLGVSRSERDAHAVPVGTPSYMAPELFSGQPADERSDVYSAGVTLYEMLTQRYPFGEIEPFSHPRFTRYTPPERYRPDMPLGLAEVLRKACAAQPKDRYANVVDLANALNSSLITRENLPAGKPPWLERVPPGRWKLLFMLSLIGNIALVLTLILS